MAATFFTTRNFATNYLLLFWVVLFLSIAGCGKRQNPTPQLASGKAFIIPSDSAVEVFKSRPIPPWAAKKYSYKPETTRFWDLIHTRLDVSFDYQKREMKGVALLSFNLIFTTKPNWFLMQKNLPFNRLVVKKAISQLLPPFNRIALH